MFLQKIINIFLWKGLALDISKIQNFREPLIEDSGIISSTPFQIVVFTSKITDHEMFDWL